LQKNKQTNKQAKIGKQAKKEIVIVIAAAVIG
jgi:hypothetical protein